MNEPLVTIEHCVAEARTLLGNLAAKPSPNHRRRLVRVFTTLAGNDVTTGLVAYYIWQWRTHLLRKQPDVKRTARTTPPRSPNSVSS